MGNRQLGMTAAVTLVPVPTATQETRVPLRNNKKVDKIYDDNFWENINDYYDFMDMYNSIHWK